MATDSAGNVVPNAPTTGWNVDYQQETVGLDASGRTVPGVKVGFITGKGVRSSVFIPQTLYTPTNVRAQIAAMAAQVDEVQGMSG